MPALSLLPHWGRAVDQTMGKDSGRKGHTTTTTVKTSHDFILSGPSFFSAHQNQKGNTTENRVVCCNTATVQTSSGSKSTCVHQNVVAVKDKIPLPVHCTRAAQYLVVDQRPALICKRPGLVCLTSEEDN